MCIRDRLFKRGAIPFIEGGSLLIYAQNVPMAKLLVKHGVDVNVPWGDLSPLSMALGDKNMPLVNYLLSAGAKATFINYDDASFDKALARRIFTRLDIVD